MGPGGMLIDKANWVGSVDHVCFFWPFGSNVAEIIKREEKTFDGAV